MLAYAHHRIREAIKETKKVVLATSGPAGIQASEVACQPLDLQVYLLVPKISDHLFNLENNPRVKLLANGWELQGEASVVIQDSQTLDLDLLKAPDAEWHALVRVIPHQVQIRRESGWGNLETIDL